MFLQSTSGVTTPPLETVTETFSTKELMLKTSVLPVVVNGMSREILFRRQRDRISAREVSGLFLVRQIAGTSNVETYVRTASSFTVTAKSLLRTRDDLVSHKYQNEGRLKVTCKSRKVG